MENDCSYPDGVWTTYTYDKGGGVTKIVRDDGSRVLDCLGNKMRSTTRNGDGGEAVEETPRRRRNKNAKRPERAQPKELSG